MFCNTANTEVIIFTFLRQRWKTIRRDRCTGGHIAVSITASDFQFTPCWHGFVKSLGLLVSSLLPYCVAEPWGCGAETVSVMATRAKKSLLAACCHLGEFSQEIIIIKF